MLVSLDLKVHFSYKSSLDQWIVVYQLLSVLEMHTDRVSECDNCHKPVEIHKIRKSGFCRLCPQCRWTTGIWCPVKNCSTPKKQQILRGLPQRLHQVPKTLHDKIMATFGINDKDTLCCKSCYTKLHKQARVTEWPSAQIPAPIPATAYHPCEVPEKGRPRTSYQDGCSKSKRKLEKDAETTFAKTVADFKEYCGEIAGGDGSVLYESVMASNFENKVQYMFLYYDSHCLSRHQIGVLQCNWILHRIIDLTKYKT